MEHSFRCLLIACRKGCFMHQNVCVFAARTACGQALVSPKMATFRPLGDGERNALPSMVLPSSKLTVSPFFRRPFRRNRRYRRNVCVWVLSLRHLAFWTRRLFRGGRDSLAKARLDCAPVGRDSPNHKGRCRGRLKSNFQGVLADGV